MRGRLPAGLAALTVALGATLGLSACAPAVPGVPGSVAPPGSPGAPAPVPPASEPASAVQGAIVIGDGETQIDIWVDFFCPFCRMFEEANGDYVERLVGRGEATLRVHPIAILDRASMGTAYSTRAAGAFACVGEYAPEEALGYFQRLYEVQPEEGTPGLTDEELAAAAPGIAADCIRDGWFGDWVGEWTQRSLEAGIRATPTVLVNTEQFPGGYDPADFRAFVESRS